MEEDWLYRDGMRDVLVHTLTKLLQVWMNRRNCVIDPGMKWMTSVRAFLSATVYLLMKKKQKRYYRLVFQ